MSTVTRSATFKRIGDAWGIRVSGVAPEQGEQVEVTRRDGSTSTVVIDTVVSQNGNDWICTFSDSATAPVAAAPAAVGFEPTDEQKQALEMFLTGQSLAIEAGAGTGKTSTLVLLANNAQGRTGQYVAFNAKIVADSGKKFPANVAANTAHSLAMRAIGKPFMPRLRSSRRVKSTELAAILGTQAITVTTYTEEQKTLSPTFLAGLVMKAIDRFCMSADAEPNYRHVPKIENLDDPDVHSGNRTNVNREVAEQLVPVMKRAWSDLTKYSGALPFRHSHYLKMWQLSEPVIHADFILFDEAQDASPVMVDIVRQQVARGTQVVWVGDSQQEIYAWAGAVNALASVPADQRTFLSQSFRFGHAVADIANRCLTELRAELRLSGFDKIDSTVGPVLNPKAILCRTNAMAMRTVLGYIADGKRPHLVGGGKEIAAFARGARDLQAGRTTDHPELACFASWGEVQEYVESDEQGEDLKLMVKLIDEFGADTILSALNDDIKAEDADVVVSTAHKSKGCEWDSVQLAGDFKDEMQGEELRLLYVAVTRAKLQLDISLVGWFNDSPRNGGEFVGAVA